MIHHESHAGRELLHAALSVAAQGWRVFPCVPRGKQPALRDNWQQVATTDPARIYGWWRRAAYNIGLACGPSRLVVLDLDVPGHGADSGKTTGKNGSDALAALCQEHGHSYPDDTLVVKTPSGGRHLYFRSPETDVSNSAGKLGSLIDVRGNGGYVVAPGSRTAQGRYEVIRPLTLKLLPDWIADLARRPVITIARTLGPPRREISDLSAYARKALDSEVALVCAAEVGTRNDTLFRSARSLGQLIAGGVLGDDDVCRSLSQAAEAAGLKPAEYYPTIQSGFRSGAKMPRGGPLCSVERTNG